MKKKIRALPLATLLFLFGVACGASSLKLVDSTAVQAGNAWAVFIGATAGQIVCTSGEAGYTFELQAEGGEFYSPDDVSERSYTTSYTLSESGEVHWKTEDQIVENSNEDSEQPVIEVLIKQEERYVGYAVVVMEHSGEGGEYTPVLIECKVLASDADRDGVTGVTFQKLIEEAEEEYLSRKT